MGLRARWTLVLVAAAAVLVIALVLAVEGARESVATEARSTWRSERAVLVHAALADVLADAAAVLEHELVVTELGDVLTDGLRDDAGGARRVLADWATRCVRNTGADEVLLLDADGRVLSGAPGTDAVGRVHPRAEDLLGAYPGQPLVFDARDPRIDADARWVVGVGRRIAAGGRTIRCVVGRRLDAARLDEIAASLEIDVLRWGAPAASRDEVALALPVGWYPGLGAHLVWDPGAPAVVRAFDRLRGRILIAGLLALVVAAIGAPWVAAGLGRPLEQMATAVGAIGRGDRHPELPDGGPREIRTLRDALVQMTRDLDRAEGRIREAERRAAWREIARRIAHEIRNALSPLSLAVDNVETAVQREDPAARSALDTSLRTARDQLHSLQRLVGEFGDFARQPRLQVGTLDVGDLLAAAVEAVRASREDVDVRLDAAEAPDSAQGDVEQLRRALHNLLVNAADASPAGRVTLAAGPGDDPDRWWIEVRDRGSGPAPAVLDRLGEPYLTTKPGGTGLGLPVTIRIVEAHGGRFTLAARDGGGAVARVELPRVVPDAASPAAEEDSV